jgi:predicted RNA-binding Zn ribbon-like protein
VVQCYNDGMTDTPKSDLRIDDSLLEELGLVALPQEEKTSLLRHIYETLEMRVGMRLADQMTNAQLDEFERFFNAQDDAGAFHWLETNFPNYKNTVAEEYAKLKGEVQQTAPQILATIRDSGQRSNQANS